MRYLTHLLALAFLLTAHSARAETCTSAGDFLWTTVDASAGEDWSGGTPCTPDASDAYVVASGSTVTIPAGTSLGSEASPLTNQIFVYGRLDIEGNTTIHHTSQISFAASSDGDWSGYELATIALPSDIRFPSSTTISITWPGSPPWPLCAAGCSENTVHPQDGPLPPTLFYFDFDKLEGIRKTAIVEADKDFTDPVGMFLEVAAVSDDSGNTLLDTVTLQLPTLGPDVGDLWYGASGGPGGRVTPDGGGRCNECLDDGNGEPAGDVPNQGARLRNDVASVDAVDEWVLQTGNAGPWALVENGGGQQRWEVYIDPGSQPFDTDREFDAYLICRPLDQIGFDPSTEDWCARITRTLANHHDGSGETLVVWKDPAPLMAGDVMNVYYARPSPGDRVSPVNTIQFQGAGAGTLSVGVDSMLGRSSVLKGIWWKNPGPAGSSGLAAVGFQNGFDLGLDLVLMEHIGDGAPRSGLAQGLLISSNGGSGSELLFHDIRVSRYHFRWPNVNADIAGGVFDPNGISIEAEHWADSDPYNTLDQWSNVALRKLRVEGSSSSVSANKMGLTSDCQDDLMIQDMALLHARNISDQYGIQAQDMIEYSGSGPRCGTDRAIGQMSVSGVTFQVRCRDCPPGTLSYYTSIVDLGEPEFAIPARGGVAFDQSGRDQIVYANFATASWIKGSGGRAVYGVRLGYYRSAGYGDWPGWGPCQSTVGLWQMGSSSTGVTLDCSYVDPPEGAVYYVDNTWLNARSSSTNRMVMSTMDTPNVPVIFENILYELPADLPGGASLVHFDDSIGGNLTSLYVNDIQIIRRNDPASSAAKRFITIEAGAIADGGLQFGPNIWAVGEAEPVRCTDTGPNAPSGAPFSSYYGCVVNDAQASGGAGVSTTGWQNTTFADASIHGDLNLRISSWDEHAAPQSTACAGTCDYQEALPRWSGLVSYDWPHAWATVDPIPGFQRTSPRLEWLPSWLDRRSGFGELVAQNDSVPDNGPGAPLPIFSTGESLASWILAPVTGTLVGLQIEWRSSGGGQPPSQETSVSLYQGGAFPVPGPIRDIVFAPTLEDGELNELRFTDAAMTIPLSLPLTAGETLVVALDLANPQVGNPLAPGVVVDDDGCQPGTNALFEQPSASWVDACLHGGTGDFVIRAIVLPDPPAAFCGNALIEVGEQCDDGNQYENDLCSAECKILPSPPSPPSLPGLQPLGLQVLAGLVLALGSWSAVRRSVSGLRPPRP